jgi:phage baseplate assembly protein gpV
MAIRELVELASRLTEIERRMAGIMRHGTVAEVDPARQRMRLDFGPAHGSDGRFLSPWVPYAQFSGALKVHTPPTVGQQFTAMSPSGDFQQAVAVPLTHHEGNPSPSTAGDENVITYGNVRMTLADDLARVDVGGSILKMTAAEITLSTNGSNIVLNAGGVTINGARIDLN